MTAPAGTQWLSSDDRIASIDAGGQLRGRSVGEATITARADSLTATAGVRIVDATSDDGYWRQIAFKEYDCSTERSDCRPLHERVLVRVPGPSPNILIRAATLDADTTRRIRALVPDGARQLTGTPYGGRIEVGDDIDADHWITIEGARPDEPSTAAHCRGVDLPAGSAGIARVGALRGCIRLKYAAGEPPGDKVILHELGHAFGFYHTGERGDLMVPGTSWGRSAEFSPQEQFHTRFAFTQPRGANYGEIQLQEFRGTSRGQYRGDGGIAVD